MGKALAEDPFFAQDGDTAMERNETIEERRLRMAKQLLEELKQEPAGPQKDDFFESLQGGKNAEAEVDIFNEEEDDLLTRRLKYQILE